LRLRRLRLRGLRLGRLRSIRLRLRRLRLGRLWCRLLRLRWLRRRLLLRRRRIWLLGGRGRCDRQCKQRCRGKRCGPSRYRAFHRQILLTFSNVEFIRGRESQAKCHDGSSGISPVNCG
jgi:hypothetical protein